jgi:hypothetical protein
MDDHDERVRRRAYQLWQEEGCPPGRADVHWDKARELVAIEDNQKRTTKPIRHTRTGPTGEPVEPIEAAESMGDLPTLTDQGEERTAPKRRRRAAAAGTSASATTRKSPRTSRTPRATK